MFTNRISNALLEEREYFFENKETILLQRQKELNTDIKEKENYILELHERVNKYEKDLNIRDAAKQEDDIQSSSVKKVSAYYISHVEKHPTKKQWENLKGFAKENLPQTYLLLNNYKLSDKESRICLLTRLKFKPGEIATIVNCTFAEVTQIRARLLKKIYGIDGKSSDFDKRLMLMY